MRLVYATLCALALTGCATNKGLYEWGGYDAVLYNS